MTGARVWKEHVQVSPYKCSAGQSLPHSNIFQEKNRYTVEDSFYQNQLLNIRRCTVN